MNKNKVILAGNITDDVKVFDKCVKFSLAVNNSFNDTTLFVDVVSFGKLGDIVKKIGEKGRGALVEGRLEIQRVKKGETWYTNVSVVAEDVQFEKRGSVNKPTAKEESTPEPEPELTEDSDIPF